MSIMMIFAILAILCFLIAALHDARALPIGMIFLTVALCFGK